LLDFPVDCNGTVISSLAVAQLLEHVPVINIDYIFADRKIEQEIKQWVKREAPNIIQLRKEEQNNG